LVWARVELSREPERSNVVLQHPAIRFHAKKTDRRLTRTILDLLLKEGSQMLRAFLILELTQRAEFNLPNAFTGEVQLFANVLERLG
jgi:hypothetical protein